jgi:hypothetical protein
MIPVSKQIVSNNTLYHHLLHTSDYAKTGLLVSIESLPLRSVLRRKVFGF